LLISSKAVCGRIAKLYGPFQKNNHCFWLCC
jgi:hypothetical protein